MRVALLLFCLASFPLLADDAYAAKAQDQVLPTAARDVLVRYSSAFNLGDCDALLELSSPALTSRLASKPGAKEDFCGFIKHMHSSLVSDSLGKVLGIRSEGPYRIAMVENLRVAGVPDSGLADTSLIYVLHSSDGGKRWWVLDLSCVDSQWIKEVYPSYDGDPPIPDGSAVVPEG